MPGGATKPRPVRGRPRTVGLDAAIVAAAVELLGEVGMVGLSMDLLAQRAGVGKATIYRRWESKEQLVIDVLQAIVEPSPTPDTGTVVGDLTAYTRMMVERFGQGRMSDVLPHLIEASCYDDQLRASLDDYSRQRQTTLRAILRRGIERGELPKDYDVDLVVEAAGTSSDGGPLVL
ncbi:MAG TPA: TetR/AcrR family transcriptional regulator, partial [Ilumatobacteraceae bacterium]|nr:TetR/AcrR family transcriptional regulator [Ilumatobacteraceae bacterium]